LGYEYLSELPVQFPGEAIAAITGKLARDYGVMPLSADQQNIDLLVSDPFNTQAIDDLTFALGRNVRLFFADPDKVDVQIKQHYGEDEASIDDLLQEISSGNLPTDGNRDLSERDIESMAEQTPIIRFVNLVIGQAIRDKASDIHFEPFEHEFKIRYRIDGALYEMAPPPKALSLPILSRIKVLAS
jgi:type IV pilus assembly protein PilB